MQSNLATVCPEHSGIAGNLREVEQSRIM